MNVIKSERVIFCDIDDTLIMHTKSAYHTYIDIVLIKDSVEGGHVEAYRNNSMIRLVKEEAARGSYIVAWSRGGYEWANAVIIALGLQEQVKQVMTKPYAYFDDSDISIWLKDRVYIEPNTNYKVKAE